MVPFASFLLSLASLFFILGHSTLLYFKVEECKDLPSIPLREAVFPSPKKGKFVSILCLALSVMWLFLMVLRLPTEGLSSFMFKSMSSFMVFFAFYILPNTFYALHLFKRIRKQSGRWLFLPLHATKEENQMPIMIGVSISFLFMVSQFIHSI